jgi:Protein of unknown function (DUF3605)
MEQYDWEQLQFSIQTNMPLARNEKHQAEYNTQKQYVHQHYESYEDYVKIAFLKWDCKRHLISGKKVAVEGGVNQIDIAVTANIFPYNVKDGIYHYLIWSLNELDNSQIEETLEKNDLKGAIYFVNSMEHRSVKGVWHTHVFSTKEL